MTQFDVIALIVLAVSGLLGFARGALRELTTIVAFLLAVAIALLALRLTGPVARHWLHPAWIGNVTALLVGFLVSYMAIRMVGAALARGVHAAPGLGGVDRVAGLGVGLIRGFVLLGAFQLVFAAATPSERMPRWISNAALYPAAEDSAEALKALKPSGMAVAGALAPALKQAVNDDGEDGKGQDKGRDSAHGSGQPAESAE